MKKLFFFAAFFLYARTGEAACSGSSPNLTAPTWEDVAPCHTAAANGDTITVTPGSYPANNPITITKFVKIVCGGVQTCHVTDNTGGNDVPDMINITESSAGSTKLQNFHFITGSNGPHGSVSAMVALIVNSGGQPILILNNLINASSSGNFIRSSTNRGVISGNNLIGVDFVSGGFCASTASFIRLAPFGTGMNGPSNYGSADTAGTLSIFIENNTILNAGEAFDVDKGGRLVLRFNQIINAAVITHDGANPSGRSFEIYGNNFVLDDNPAYCPGLGYGPAANGWIFWRAGTGIVVKNVIPNCCGAAWGVKTELGVEMETLNRNYGPFGCWTGGYPAPYSVGWGYTVGGTVVGGIAQDLEPFVVAGNDNAGSGDLYNIALVDYPPGQGDSCMPTGPTTASFVQRDRDFYPQLALNLFNGTSSASQGLRSQRPATCTTGVYFWSTDFGGNWDTTNADANDGALDRCTATNTWTNNWYVPFVYPHPDVSPTEYLAFSSQPTNIQSAALFSPAVAVNVHQPNGSVDTGATGTIALTMNGCGSALTGTTTGTPSSGLVTFTGLGAVGAATGCTISAGITGGTIATATTSNSFNVTASPSDHLSFSQQPGNVTAGDAFSPTITVTVVLPGGGTDTGASGTVAIAISGCGASLTGTATASVSTGVATFTGLGATGSGSGCTLAASISGGTVATGATSNTFNVTPYFLTFSQQPGTIVSGTAFFPVITVTVNQPGGGTYVGAKGTITLTKNSCTTAVWGSTTAMPVTGVATFTGLGATGAGTGCTFTASISGGTFATAVVSNSFNVTTTTGPTLTSISPTSGQVGKVYNMILTGTRFDGGNAAVNITGIGVTISNVVVVSATRITATFALAGKAIPGARSVTVTTDEGMSGAKTFTLTKQNNPKAPAKRAKAPAND